MKERFRPFSVAKSLAILFIAIGSMFPSADALSLKQIRQTTKKLERKINKNDSGIGALKAETKIGQELGKELRRTDNSRCERALKKRVNESKRLIKKYKKFRKDPEIANAFFGRWTVSILGVGPPVFDTEIHFPSASANKSKDILRVEFTVNGTKALEGFIYQRFLSTGRFREGANFEMTVIDNFAVGKINGVNFEALNIGRPAGWPNLP